MRKPDAGVRDVRDYLRGILAIGLAFQVCACAQSKSAPDADSTDPVQTYLAGVPAIAGEGNMGGGSSSQAQMTYVFTCLERRYTFAITAHYVGEKPNHRVDLGQITSEWGRLSAGDRRRIQDELGQFTNINTLSLRCASDGTYAYLLSGYGRNPDAPPSPQRTRLIWFDHERLLRID